MNKFIIFLLFFAVSFSLDSTPTEKSAIKPRVVREKKNRFILDEMKARYDVLREEFIRRGWEEQTNKVSPMWDFKWTFTNTRLRTTNTRKIVNHFENFAEVGTKKGLIQNLKKLQKNNPDVNIYDFFPRSYLLENESPDEREDFIRDFERTKLQGLASISNEQISGETLHLSSTLERALPPLQSIDGNKNVWIVKPASNARGVGIKLFDNITAIFEYTKEGAFDGFIVQKYIEEPLIIQNKKFDIRQFVLVTSLDPLIIFVFEDCYLRFCTKEYTLENIKDEFIHLTNHQIQKNSEVYNESGIRENQWSLEMFKQYISDELKQPGAWETKVKPAMNELIITSLKSWPKEGHRNSSFELLGFDIMLDRNLKPYLIEINTNPGLHMLTDIVRPHHTKAQIDILKVVIDHPNLWKSGSVNDDFGDKFGAWKLVYKDEKKK